MAPNVNWKGLEQIGDDNSAAVNLCITIMAAPQRGQRLL